MVNGMTIEEIVKMADYMITCKCTIRKVADKFSIPKSIVHSIFTNTLPSIDLEKYNEIRVILEYNKSVAHVRGGEATKLKYKGK